MKHPASILTCQQTSTPVNVLLYIIALGQDSEIIISLNVMIVNLKSFGK
jgi:hypothetical protein